MAPTEVCMPFTVLSQMQAELRFKALARRLICENAHNANWWKVKCQ